MNEQRLYETTFIINAALEDHQVEAIAARIQDIITKNGDEIVAVNRWGRKRLAYPINKKNNGYYINIEFKGKGETIKQLEHVYHLDEHILRYLTIKVEKNALKAREMKPVIAEEEVLSELDIVDIKQPLFEDEEEEPPAK
jgi:small subunit ribosomal protein S6